jgi:hypothetical protein
MHFYQSDVNLTAKTYCVLSDSHKLAIDNLTTALYRHSTTRFAFISTV